MLNIVDDPENLSTYIIQRTKRFDRKSLQDSNDSNFLKFCLTIHPHLKYSTLYITNQNSYIYIKESLHYFIKEFFAFCCAKQTYTFLKFYPY